MIVYGFAGPAGGDACRRLTAIMLDDARTLEEGAGLEADVCIVGGGAAGLTVAGVLAESPASVLVLESGGPASVNAASDTGATDTGASDRPERELLEGRARGKLLSRNNRYLVATRRRQLGGQANRWHRECGEFEGEDFASRSWAAGSGWPLAREDLAGHYAAARKLLDLPAAGATSAHEFGGADPRFSAQGLDFAPTPALGAGWRRSVVRAPGVRLLTHATVVALALDDAGNQVAEAVVRCLDGPSFRVRARQFVLAAGTLENARLLLASNDRRSAGLGNGHDLVGRYFMEQPVLRPGPVYLAAAARELTRFTPPAEVAGSRLALRPLTRTRERHELLNSTAWIEPASPADGGSLGRAVARSVNGLSRLAGAVDEPGLFGALILRGEQLPNAASRLVLSEERDPLGMPRIDLTWIVGQHDSWSLRTTARLLGEALGRQGLGRLQVRVGHRLRRRYYGWSAHQCGTTRMGRTAASGVVDPDCRVHEVPNLSIVGASVFPTSGSSGPMLTILALALRLAERLRRELDR